MVPHDPVHNWVLYLQVDYEGTARNPVFKTDKVAPFKAVCEWLHDVHKVPRQEHFNEIVANIYSRPKNQSIGAHTDQNPLLGETSDILSLSMGAAGVFFWHPSQTGQLRGWGKKELDRHAREREQGFHGCVPLLPGDLFLATGTFQKHLVHGALSYRDAANVYGVLSKWAPARMPEEFWSRRRTKNTLTTLFFRRTGR